MKLWRLPLRLAAGAFVLDQGLQKRGMDRATAAQLQDMASQAVPQAEELETSTFAALLPTAEIALGAALLAPFVPARLAGLGLLAFSGNLVRLYLETPGMTREGSVFPTQDGLTLAKDSWLAAIALALVLGGGSDDDDGDDGDDG